MYNDALIVLALLLVLLKAQCEKVVLLLYICHLLISNVLPVVCFWMLPGAWLPVLKRTPPPPPSQYQH